MAAPVGCRARRARTGGTVRLPAPARRRSPAARRQHSAPLQRLHSGRLQRLAGRGREQSARLLPRQRRSSAPARGDRLQALRRRVPERQQRAALPRQRAPLLRPARRGQDAPRRRDAARADPQLPLPRTLRRRHLVHQDLQSAIDPDAPFSRNELLEPIENAEVLVVDELGAQSLRPWAADVLYDLVNRRYARRLPTLFTTNYRLDDAAARVESLTADRAVAELRGAATVTRRAEPAMLQGAALLSRRIPGMLVSRLWEMAQVISLDAVKDFRMEVRAPSASGAEGRPRWLLVGLRAGARRGARRRHHRARKSSDLAGATPPPPYRGAEGSIVVRVGLETDLRRLSVPCCERVWVEHGGTRRAIDGGSRGDAGRRGQEARPTSCRRRRSRTRIRRASWRARSSVRPARRRRSSFDVASSFYRVRLGRFETRDAADRLAQRLVDQGIDGAWVVMEGGGLERAALVLADGTPRATREAEGRWLVVEPDAQSGVRARARPVPRAHPGLSQRSRAAQPDRRAADRGLPARRGPGRDGARALRQPGFAQGTGGGGAHVRRALARRLRRRRASTSAPHRAARSTAA